MHRLAVVFDCNSRLASLKAHLTGFFELDPIPLHELAEKAFDTHTLIDIDLADPAHVLQVKKWLRKKPKNSRAVFSAQIGIRHELVQARAIGATDIVDRPVNGALLFRTLSGGLAAIAVDNSISKEDLRPGLSKCIDALQDLFFAATSGNTPDLAALKKASTEIVTQIADDGVSRWLQVIRSHHSQTYQHCLLVTAVAVAFGQMLGFGQSDKQRLASAALLHDFGKALIPVEILEKPGPLDSNEMDVMRTHAERGFEALRRTSSFEREILDLVLHHHEYLDGSGYPHGIGGGEIADIVRVITIADVYAALIECRPYKKPLPSDRAYELLQGMGTKLDADLVRAFGPLAQILH